MHRFQWIRLIHFATLTEHNLGTALSSIDACMFYSNSVIWARTENATVKMTLTMPPMALRARAALRSTG